MKAIGTIIFLLFVTTQTFAQSSINIEAIRSYIANNSPKENERLVNEIYLQKERVGIESISPMRKQMLYNIAHQCPTLGGTAVYRARSIYALIAYDTYDDDCDNLPQLRMRNMSSGDTCYSEVKFLNPSLEGIPLSPVFPLSWSICESTPDIHPFASFSIPPSNGTSYVGLGATSTFKESFGQQIGDTLLVNTKYRFVFDFAKALVPTGEVSIWISDSLCEKYQLIYSATTTDTLWHPHIVEFIPNDNYNYIIISAEPDSYIFIDNLRSISQPFGCDTISSITPILPDRTDNLGDDVYTNITTTEPSEFKIYPNPNTQGQLMVEWTNPIQNGKLVLIDALGREVRQYIVDNNVASQQIDIQTLPSGYYTVLLETNKQVIGREKLIVIKQ